MVKEVIPICDGSGVSDISFQYFKYRGGFRYWFDLKAA
jgi:hypothetical protein